MARNKNSTALFDVIHAAKKPPKSSPSASIPAPRWWGKDKPLPKPAVTDAAENGGKQRSWLSAARQYAGAVPSAIPVATAPAAQVDGDLELLPPHETEAPHDLKSDPAESAPVVASEPMAVVPKTRFIDRFKTRPSQPTSVSDPSADAVEHVDLHENPDPASLPSPDVGPVAPELKPERQAARATPDSMMSVDRASGDIRFKLSYGAIIAIGFILLMVLAIAFIAGTHTQFALLPGDSTDTRYLPGPVAPASGMMAAVGTVKPPDADHPVMPDVLSVSAKSPGVAAQSTAASAPPLPIKATRDIGMIYVVIQSYPDQDLAQKACDFVNHAGVPCTLVQGLSGWAMRDWYSVVGLQPFKKHDPGLEEYEKAATALGVKFSTNVLNRFQPQGYTWRVDSDQGNTE